MANKTEVSSTCSEFGSEYDNAESANFSCDDNFDSGGLMKPNHGNMMNFKCESLTIIAVDAPLKFNKFAKRRQDQEEDSNGVHAQDQFVHEQLSPLYIKQQYNKMTSLGQYKEQIETPKSSLLRFKQTHKLTIEKNTSTPLLKSRYNNGHIDSSISPVGQCQSKSSSPLKQQQKPKQDEFLITPIPIQSGKEYNNVPFFDENEILKKIGEGGHSNVYKVQNIKTRDVFACKVYRSDDEEIHIVIRNEYEMLKSIKHPNILKVFQLFEYPSQGIFIILMEYLDSQCLTEFIQQNQIDNKTTNEIQYQDTIKIVITQMLQVIDFLHTNGISHRDIQPENVMISKERDLKLIDFNVSKYFNKKDQICNFHTPTGKPKYRAPEMSKGMYNEKNDIWMAGLLVLFLATGTDLSSKKVASKLTHNNKWVSELNTIKNNWLKLLISNMLIIDYHFRMSAKHLLESQYFK